MVMGGKKREGDDDGTGMKGREGVEDGEALRGHVFFTGTVARKWVVEGEGDDGDERTKKTRMENDGSGWQKEQMVTTDERKMGR